MFLCHIFPALISLPIGVWAYRATGNHWNAESPEFCCTSCYSRSLEWPWSHPQRYACITIKINTVSPQEKKKNSLITTFLLFWGLCCKGKHILKWVVSYRHTCDNSMAGNHACISSLLKSSRNLVISELGGHAWPVKRCQELNMLLQLYIEVLPILRQNFVIPWKSSIRCSSKSCFNC